MGNRAAAKQGHGKKQARKDPNAPLSSDPEADRLAREILKASAGAQQNLIDDLRDSKGAVNTVALAVVIPHLSGTARQKARDALVMRLTRMTSSTLRDKLDQTVQQRRRSEQQIQEISQEQARMRENMGRLAQNSELYNRYVRKLDQQETEIDKVRKDIETLKGTEEQQRKELNDYLMGLDIG